MKKIQINLLIFAFLGIAIYGCQPAKEIEIVTGVSRSIADFRTKSIFEPEYELNFSIPESKDQAIVQKNQTI